MQRIFSRRTFVIAALCVAIPLIARPCLAADTPPSPQQLIESFHTTLLDVMQHADALGYEGRYKKLEPVLLRTFNIPAMTKTVVRAPWNDWNDAERDQVSAAFGRYIVSTYARRFDGYSGETFVFDGTKPMGTNILVETHIARPNDTDLVLNYLIQNNDQGAPKAVDVYFNGTISQLATTRSEFGAVLQRGGLAGLLEIMGKKTGPGTN